MDTIGKVVNFVPSNRNGVSFCFHYINFGNGAADHVAPCGTIVFYNLTELN